MELRPMFKSDLERGLELCRLAEWNQVRADWDYFLAHANCFVAEVGGEVMGTCAVLDPSGPTARIAMMLVDPAARRQSIGRRLFERTLSCATAPSIGLDGTAFGRPLYAQYGFVESREIIRFKAVNLTCPPCPDPPARYRAGHSSMQIGPILAESPAEAIASAQSLIARFPVRNWITDVPFGAPQAWTDWLLATGFVVQRPLMRMYRGQSRLLPSNVYATSGPEYGHHARSDD